MKIEIDDREAEKLLNFLETVRDNLVWYFNVPGTNKKTIKERAAEVEKAYKSLSRYSNIQSILNDTLRGKNVNITTSSKGYATITDAYTGRVIGYAKDYEEAAKMYGKKLPSIKKIK